MPRNTKPVVVNQKKKKIKNPNKKTSKLRQLLIRASFSPKTRKISQKNPSFRISIIVSRKTSSIKYRELSLIKCPSPGNERMPATATALALLARVHARSRSARTHGAWDKGDSLSARGRACTRFVSLCLWDGCL